MDMLSPHHSDPFEPYKVLQSNLRIWQFIAAGLIVCLAITWAWGTLGWSRPPIVITKDRLHGEPAVVSRGDSMPAVTEADARVFFLNMVQLRFGWDSLTVMRDMREFRKHCYKDHWAQEVKHFEDPIPSANEPHKTTPRLQWWVQQGVRNHLALPKTLEDIFCKEQDAMFHCKMDASVVTQSLLPVVEEDPVVQRMAFVGTLFQVPHQIETPYGLLVGALRELPIDDRKEPKG